MEAKTKLGSLRVRDMEPIDGCGQFERNISGAVAGDGYGSRAIERISKCEDFCNDTAEGETASDALASDARAYKCSCIDADVGTYTVTFTGAKVRVCTVEVTSEDPIKGERKCMCILNEAVKFVEFVNTVQRGIAEAMRVLVTKDPRKEVCAVARKLSGQNKSKSAIASKGETENSPTITPEGFSNIPIKECRCYNFRHYHIEN
jgi:hypothetical protein